MPSQYLFRLRSVKLSAAITLITNNETQQVAGEGRLFRTLRVLHKRLSAQALGVTEKHLKRLILAFLAIVGSVALALFAILFVLVVFERIDESNPDASELSYILNWGELGDHSKITSVARSCITPRNFLVGDQTKVYDLSVSPIARETWQLENIQEHWQQGPIADPIIIEAMETATLFANSAGCGWFPNLNSSRFFLSFPRITAYNRRVEAVQVTAYDTKSHHIYHADVRW